MRNRLKRPLAMLLTLCMLFGMIPTASFAEEDGSIAGDENVQDGTSLEDGTILADDTADISVDTFAIEGKTFSQNTSISGAYKGTIVIEQGVTVTVTGPIIVEAGNTLSIEGSGSLRRAANFTNDSMITVADTATLNIGGDVTLDGAAILMTGKSGGAVNVSAGGKFNMNDDATIQNFKTNATPGGAAVFVNATNSKAGVFNMNGGKITNNRYESQTQGQGGGGVAVLGTLNMSGGEVSNNYSGTNGGGLFLAGNHNGGQNATIIITGGSIVGNTARRWGGAVEALGNRDCGESVAKAVIKITGGTITGNLSNYQNPKANDGFGGGVEASGMEGDSTVGIGGDAIITGNNHWNASGYTQDNLYTNPKLGKSKIQLISGFTGTVGVSPEGGQSAGGIFANKGGFTSTGTFFYDGKPLTGKASGQDMIWATPEQSKPLTGVTVALVDGEFAASVSPAGAGATYQWYVSSTSNMSAGLPISGETEATFTPTLDMTGKYVYVIADGKGSSTGRATSALTQVAAAPKLATLAIAPGTLSPKFNKDTNDYTATVGSNDNKITLSLNAENNAAVTVKNGGTVVAGTGSYSIELQPGRNEISIAVGSSAPYTIVINKPVAVGSYPLFYNAADGKLHQGSINGTIVESNPSANMEYVGAGNVLTLKNFVFSSTKTALELGAGNTLTLEGNSFVESTSKTLAGGSNADMAIHASGNLTINGDGTLVAKAAGTAIVADDALTIEGKAIVTAEGTGYLGTSSKADSAGISVAKAITVKGDANVTAIGGASNANSYGLGGADAAVNVGGNGVLTAIGGQITSKGNTDYRSMGICTQKAFAIKDSGVVVMRGDTVAVDLQYKLDKITNPSKGTVVANDIFKDTEIKASQSTNGSGTESVFNEATDTASGYKAFVDGVNNWETPGVASFKWAQVMAKGASAQAGYVAAPAFSHAAGQHSNQIAVELFSRNNTIYYTLDGSDPANSATRMKYVSPVVLNVGNATIKAIANNGSKDSLVASASYNVVAAPKLSELALKNMILAPGFNAGVMEYRTVAASGATTTTLTANAASGVPVQVLVGGKVVAKSGASYPITLATGENTSIMVTVGAAPVTTTYAVAVVRAKEADVTKVDTYEPLNIISGFNKDVVVEKAGNPANSADPFDGLNSSAQFAFYAKSYSTTGKTMPDNNTFGDGKYKIASYSAPNSVQVSWDNPSADIRFSTIGTYDRLSIVGSSGNNDGHFKATIHYTDGTTSAATFTAPNWSYAAGKSLPELSRVKLVGDSKTSTGKIENGLALYAFDIPVTQGKLISHLNILRTDSTTGDTAARTNIMAVSGVVSKGTIIRPEAPAAGVIADGKFTAQWDNSDSAVGYYIDISASKDFTDMVPGYNNKLLTPDMYKVENGKASYDASNVTASPVFYRVRAVNSDGKQSQSSEPAEVTGGSSTPGADGPAVGMSLNKSVAIDAKLGTYGFPNAVVTSAAKTIVVGFSSTVEKGDWIELPSTSGFTVSGSSNEYSKLITIAAGKTDAEIQNYLRQIVFHLNANSTTKKSIQVTLSSQANEYDTFYNEQTGHYYQFVPFARNEGSKTWADAYEAARSMTYAGRNGYLATITSAAEDNFIRNLSGQIGWLGGTKMFAGVADTEREDAAGTKDTTGQYYGKDVQNHADQNASWAWACGPEIGKVFSDSNGTAQNGLYENWNSGEPSGKQHNVAVTDDQHECALTTLFQGAGGFSWNDRAIAANIYGAGATAGYQPYGYFVEYGDKETGNNEVNPASTATDTQDIDPTKAAISATDGFIDLTKIPEPSGDIASDPNWKLVAGTNPIEYKYVGKSPANGEGENWSWHYVPGLQGYYVLVLNGVDLVTTNRPAISFPDLPRGNSQPVRIRVMDGSVNRIENLEDEDKSTDVTVIESPRDLVIEASGPKNTGALTLVGSNMADSKKGVYGINSIGSVTIKNLVMAIELTDNRKGDGAKTDPSTGIKSEGDITLDNPIFNIKIKDERPADIAEQPARGMEPGYPRNNVIINGGETDIKLTPNGNATYPTYRPVIVDGVPIGDPTTIVYPIKPAAPVVEVVNTYNVIIYANGGAVVAKAGTTDGTTSIYLDKNRDGAYDVSDQEITGAIDIASDKKITIYAGAKDKSVSGWPKISVVDGGRVDNIYAGGQAVATDAVLNGNPEISVSGGKAVSITDGGLNAAGRKATVNGLVNINVSGNAVVTEIVSKESANARSTDTTVSLSGGNVATLSTNSKHLITLNLEGTPNVGIVTDYTALTGGKANIVSAMTAEARVNFQVDESKIAEGTILATATDAANIHGTFTMVNAAGTVVLKKQLIVEDVNVKIAGGGPTKLDKVDLSEVTAPTGPNDKWTGPAADGTYEYKGTADEGWKLIYHPTPLPGYYTMQMNGLNIETNKSPAINLPADKPTIIELTGKNKIVVRGEGDLVGINAPVGVEIKGKDPISDTLDIVIDSTDKKSATGIKGGDKTPSGGIPDITPENKDIVNIIDNIILNNITNNIVITSGTPAKGIQSEKDVILKDGNLDIEIPGKNGPATGVIGDNITILDTNPSDNRKPQVDIAITGDKDNASNGLKANDDIIIGGAEVDIKISNGAPAIGIVADDDVVIMQGEADDKKPGTKPKVDIVIGDKNTADNNSGVSPATGILAGDKDTGADDDKGIFVDNGDVNIVIPNPPANYKPTGDVGYDENKNAPNKGMDSKGDITVKDGANLDIEMTGPGSGIHADKDVVSEDSNVVINIKPIDKPASNPAVPYGPAVGIDAGNDVKIIDTKPSDGRRPITDIVIDNPDKPSAGGTPSIAINTDPSVLDPKNTKPGGDVIVDNNDVTIDITKGVPAIGINADDDVIIKSDPARPATKPVVDINIGDRSNPATGGSPAIGIKAEDKAQADEAPNGIAIGGGAVEIVIPNPPADYKPTDDASYDEDKNAPNKGMDSKGDIIVNEESSLEIEVTGPAVGLDSDKKVELKDSDVNVIVKPSPLPTDPTKPYGPTIGINGDTVDIIDSKPNDNKKPETNIVIPKPATPGTGGKPAIGINTDPSVLDSTEGPANNGDVNIKGADLKIDIATGAPAIGINADDDVVIKPGDPTLPNTKPDVEIGIGEKNDPATGGQPGTGIKADNKNEEPGTGNKNGVIVDNTDLNINVNIRPGATKPDGTPDSDNKGNGIESSGDVDIKGSDVVIDVTDDTKPATQKGKTDGIVADDRVAFDDSLVDIIVTGRPGTGIRPNADQSTPASNDRLEIKGDTQLDINVKPGDPSYNDPTDPAKKNAGVDGDIVINSDPAAPSKPNINITGKPAIIGVIEDKDKVLGDPAPSTDGDEFNVITNTIMAELTLQGGTEEAPALVSGKMNSQIVDVSDVRLVLTGAGATFKAGAYKTGDTLATNCPGVMAVVTSVNSGTSLTLKLTGTPTANRGTAISVTIASGKLEGTNVGMKVTSDQALWAIAMLETVSRVETLDLTKYPVPYTDETGENKEATENPANPNAPITDGGEGWEWHPKYTGPEYPQYKDMPVLILKDADIEPTDDKPAIKVPDGTIIVVEPGTGNKIIGGKVAPNTKPAIEVSAPATGVTITGPGDLIIKGAPKAIADPIGNDVAITVDPDTIIKGDKNPIAPTGNPPKVPSTYEEMSFGHIGAVIDVLQNSVVGVINQPIKTVKGAQVLLQNASLKPNTVRVGAELETNSLGIRAYVTDISVDRSVITVDLAGTPAAVSSDKVMVTIPSNYVVEEAKINAISTQRWNITLPSPGPVIPPSGGSVVTGGEEKLVDIDKEVRYDGDNKINVFVPDDKQLSKVVGDQNDGSEITLIVEKDKDAVDVIVKIKGDTLDEMAKKNITLKIVEDDVVLEIPTKKINTEPALKDLNGQLEDVDVNIRVFEPTPEEKKKIAEAIQTSGSVQTGDPISFEITVGKGDKKVPINGFDGYVTVSIRVTAEQANSITTAITWQKDGSLLHIPTVVYSEKGKYYAKVNALVNCTTTLISNKQTFPDTQGTWFNEIASELASRKIMNGTPDGTFAGKSNITRAEFAAIMVRALGLPMNTASDFADIEAHKWYADAVGAAAKFGIISGYEDNSFRPGEPITRQEAMSIIARASKVAEFEGTTGSTANFADSDKLADWAKDAANMTVGSGLYKGDNGQLRPNDNIIRGEAATLVLRLLQKAELVDVRSAT